MLRNSRGIAAFFLRGSKSRLQWLLKTEIAPLSHAALATTTKSYQAEEDTDNGSNLTDVSAIIQSGIGNSYNKAFKAIKVLSDLVEAKKADFKNDIEKDKDFGRLLASLDSGPNETHPAVFLNGLKNLLKLGISEDAHVIQSAENHLLWNLRKASIPTLISILSFKVHHQKTDSQRMIVKETVDSIQRRWVEIRGAREFQEIYSLHDFFTVDFLGQIDDRIIELTEEMSHTELSGIFCALGTTKRRATPVLRAIAFHLAKRENKLNPKQLSNMLFAMHTLNFPDQMLLDKIANDLIPQVASITKSSIIGTILFCMGQMRWKQLSLLEVICEWVESNSEICRTNDLVSLVVTLAYVAYTPMNVETLFAKIIPKLDYSSVNRESAWLDVVWSLSLMGRVTQDHISSVLDRSFTSRICSSAHPSWMGLKLKLLNINTIAKIMMPTYTGPFLDTTEFKDIIITQSRNELNLSKHIYSMLHNFLPPPKYIRENIQTSMGIFVNCELAVDPKGKPLPIQDYTDNFGESASIKPLPEGAMKMALFVWDYKDYTIGSQDLTGVNQFALQVLEKVGYKVVQVPYFEYNMRGKIIKNVQYLESKIKEAAGAL